MTREVYEGMTLASLKEIAKELNIKNISKYKKSELIDEIIENKVNSIEKDGVILKEKIAPKVKEIIQIIIKVWEEYSLKMIETIFKGKNNIILQKEKIIIKMI